MLHVTPGLRATQTFYFSQLTGCLARKCHTGTDPYRRNRAPVLACALFRWRGRILTAFMIGWAPERWSDHSYAAEITREALARL